MTRPDTYAAAGPLARIATDPRGLSDAEYAMHEEDHSRWISCIVSAFRKRGYAISRREAAGVWVGYSDTYCASWLGHWGKSQDPETATLPDATFAELTPFFELEVRLEQNRSV